MKFLSKIKDPKNIWMYIIGSTVFTAICWIPALILADKNNYEILSPSTFAEIYINGFQDGTHLMLSLLFSLGVYGPMLFAFIVAGRDGEQGRSTLARAMIKWKVKPYWYLMIPLLAVLLVLPALLIGLLSNLIDFSQSYFTVELALAFFLFQLISSALEEPGWRGYLLPKLLEEYTAEQASVRLGILWSIWHWPFVIYFTLTKSDIAAGEPDRELIMFLLVVQTLFFFTLSTVGISFIYTWIYVNTKSVFLAICFHAFENFSSTYFQSITSPVLSVVLGASPWLIAAFLLKKYDKETLLINPPKKIMTPAVAIA